MVKIIGKNCRKIDIDDVREYEAKLNFKLPEDYTKFLVN